ncbi:hypothetical protein ElyMa_006755500 [Elysia marginata]|uniref:Transmembrane protein 208 n=1 Tax=Elysia marginata TaxID=1093978 RepID=A0AAV4IWP0_9GAST|nr:hypothetical protein ElyMa_006755500 [Elysia marginata]
MSNEQIKASSEDQGTKNLRKISQNSISSRSTLSHRLKQTSKVKPACDDSTEQPQTKKQLHSKPQLTKFQPRRAQVGNRMKGGVQLVQNSGDFLGRLGTLVVMLVTMISTAVVTVSSFVEGVYWKFGLLAALLLFVHLPVTIAMIWMMCKARVKSLYKKVRPAKHVADLQVVEAEKHGNTETLDNLHETTNQDTPSKTVNRRANKDFKKPV